MLKLILIYLCMLHTISYKYILKENNAKLLAIIDNISARFITNVTNHKV